MTYHVLHRKWRVKKTLWVIMILQLGGLIPILVLFGLAQPDMYRTKFWEIGFINGWNSNPNMILYAYANHRPLPTVPFVWSQALTNFNVAISVLSLFILLTNMIGFIMRIWYPVVSLFFNFAMTALYATSVYGQAGPDYADSRYPSSVAWYIAKGCDAAAPYNMTKSCQMAKGSFAVTIYMLFLYLVSLGLAIWSMLPSKNNADDYDNDDDDDDRSAGDEKYEMQPATPRVPFTPSVPFTPRTQAFHTLDRKLPLRQS